MSSTRSIQFHTKKFTKHCGFCKETGHKVKDCIVLANNECNYCHQLGHTTRRCNVLSKKNCSRRQTFLDNRQRDTVDENGWSIPKRISNKIAGVRKNIKNCEIANSFHFAFLDIIDESEPMVTQSVTFNIPTFSEAKPAKGVWSKPLKVQKTASKPVEVQKTASKPVQKKVSIFKTTRNPPGTRWADMCDTDSDDED